MTHWWRAYDEAVDDPKLQRLPGELFKVWFNVMCLASAGNGVLPPLADVAFKLRMSEAKAEKVLSMLGQAGLLDIVSGGQLQPHNWNGRQFQSNASTERVKRFRKRQRNVSSTVSETSPDTDTDTDPDTDPDVSSLRSETTRARARGSPIAEMFDLFWQLYPNKVGKKDADKSFEKVMKSGTVEFEKLMQGLHRYVRKTDDRPWCNPATWLNQGRWEDQPAAVNGNGKSVLAAADRQLEQLGGQDAADRYVPGSQGPRSLDQPPGQADFELLPPGGFRGS
jgi:hypothetical protein